MSPENGVTGSCEPTTVDVGNQILEGRAGVLLTTKPFRKPPILAFKNFFILHALKFCLQV